MAEIPKRILLSCTACKRKVEIKATASSTRPLHRCGWQVLAFDTEEVLRPVGSPKIAV